MTAQKKTIIKGAFLRVMGNSRRESINILVIIENRDCHRVQVRALSGEGFLHLKPAEMQLCLFHQAREYGGVDGMNVQHRVGLGKQAVNQRMQPGFCRGFTARRRAVAGDVHLQEIVNGQAAFVFARFAEPAKGVVLANRHVSARRGCPAFCANPAAGVDQVRELQVVCHFPFPSVGQEY
ncbi:hypothetical protein D3C78_800010 [compost metagenome]